MEDQRISELCRRIYKNHRQALELISLHAGTPTAGILSDIAELIESKPRWKVVARRPSAVDFVLAEWADVFPAIGKRKKFDLKCWVVLKFRMGERRCVSEASVWPTKDVELRSKVIDRLTKDPAEFGFKLFSKKIVDDNFAAIGGKYVISDWGDEEPDAGKVMDGVTERLQTLEQKMKGVPNALRPILEPAIIR
jgi:hypothetical protein